MFVVFLAVASPAAAHRVDEYLQATRIAVGMDRIDVEVDLTPGMTMASDVARRVDTNGDGRVSGAEAERYGREILESLSLTLDGRRLPIVFVAVHVPELADMTLGTGTIKLRAAAGISPRGSGHHQLDYANMHRSESSVFLVNALVPADARIQITNQRRDTAQHRLTLEYTVTAHVGWTVFLIMGLATVGVLGTSRLPRPSTPS